MPYRPGYVWLSICSAHPPLFEQDDCDLCKKGYWVSNEDFNADRKLFESDYAEWYRRHNSGEEPTESAWETWKQITQRRVR